MRFFLAIFILIISHARLAGQAFTIYNYSVPDGLPSSEVYDVYQDKKGFLWFATDNGVVKFDGHQMQIFHTKDGLSDPVVFGFFEDKKGRLWFRTFSGKLSYHDNGKISRYPYNEKLGKINFVGLVNFIVKDNNELWFTVRNIFGKIDSAGTVTSTVIKEEGLYYKTIDDNFLLGTSNSVKPIESIIIDDKKFPVDLSETAYQNRVHCSIRWKDGLYFSINTDIFRFDGDTITKVLTSKFPIISLSKDKDDHLWVGYLNGGVERYTENNFTEPWKPEFLKNKSVTKIIHDHEGGYWFTTLENGVFHVPNLFIEHFTFPSPSRIKAVLSLPDVVLVGDQAGNLFGLDHRDKRTLWIKNFEPPILSMFANAQNRIWLSTNGKIRVLNRNLKTEKEYLGLSIDFSEDNKGIVWAYGGNRIRSFDAEGNLLGRKSLNVPYRSLHADDSLLFMADRTGLHIRDKNLKIVQLPKDFADFKISNMFSFNDSTLLIATIGSGFILQDKRTGAYIIYNSQNNFIADNIYSTLLEGSYLWLGTEKGLIKIPVSGLFKSELSFQYLTRKSGLMSDKIDFLLKVNNDLWAFYNNAFSVIPLNFSKFANAHPLFYIREVKINDRVIASPLPAHLELSHVQNDVYIDFGFTSFNNQNIFLRYRLTERDHWIYTGNKQLFFSSLAPGTYSFDLEYSTDNVHWRSAAANVNFTISQPWWNEWYTYAGVTVLFLTAAYFYFRYQKSIYRQRNHYLKIINEHQQKLIQSEIVTLERERNRISKELHDRVGTNLSAIKLTVNQLLQHYKEPQSAEVEQQFQIAIQEIKEIIYGLTPPSLERYGLFTGLKNYIGKLNKTIPITIALKTFGREIENYDFNIIIFRILQELLTNSIRHSYAKNITIHINSFDDVLNIVYEDDGIGFSYDPLQNGLGLDNVESRIHSVKGTLKFDSGKFGISYTIDIPVNLNKEVV
jgi:signal transduction histidine kinase/ligand-binding sensor domain-containing protein